MILSRLHRPAHTVTLAALCREAGCPCSVQTDWPLRVERLPGWEGTSPPTRHWRNLPDGSYSTFLGDAAAIIALLAYEAHEWQAWEVRREMRRHGTPRRFALLT